MASTVAVTIAFLLHFYGINLFLTPELSPNVVESPPLPGFIFLCSVYGLFLDTIIYPRSFRRVHLYLVILIEFLVSKFGTELFSILIWNSLEWYLYHGMPAQLNSLDLFQGERSRCLTCFHRNIVYDKFGGYRLSCFLDYTIAVGCLLTVLHATRKQDIKIVRGKGAQDIKFVLRKFILKLMYAGPGAQKRRFFSLQ